MRLFGAAFLLLGSVSGHVSSMECAQAALLFVAGGPEVPEVGGAVVPQNWPIHSPMFANELKSESSWVAVKELKLSYHNGYI